MKKIFFTVLLISIFIGTRGQEAGSLIRGTVTDQSGKPLQGAAVVIQKPSRGTVSDESGHFSFGNLADGNYSLRFSFIGYETQTISVSLKGLANVNAILKASAFSTGEVLVSATRAGEKTPLAFTTVNNEDLAEMNAVRDIPFLLSLTPSLVETSESGNGIGYTSMRIRGTDANRINVTIDGIPLNDPESQTVFWVDLPDLASSVDNIQIQRGVGTSSHGAGAFGATVSIETLSPDNDPSAMLSTSAGSFNTLRNVVSAGTGLLGNRFAFNLRYSDLRSDGFIDRTGSDHRSAFLSGVYRSGRSRLKANIILGEERTGIGWWGVPKDSLKTNRTYNPAGEYTDEAGNLAYYPDESDNYKQGHYQLMYNFSPSGEVSLNAALHYTRGRGYYEEFREEQSFAEYGLDPVSAGNISIEETDIIRRKWLDNHFYGFVWSAIFRHNRLELTGGGGMNSYLGGHYGTLIWMGNAGATPKDFRWYDNNARKSEFNIFGKVSYDLSDKLRLFGDLQYRNIWYAMKGPDDDLKQLSVDTAFMFFNPKAGLFWSVSSRQDAWLSFAVANREPSRNDFKEAEGDPKAEPKPETLYDAELGYRIRIGESVFGLNLYAMFYKDQLVPTGELSDVGYSIMTNVENSYRTGAELTAAFRISELISWQTNLTLSSNKIRNFTEYAIYYNTSDWSEQYQGRHLGLVDIAYSPGVIWSSDLGFVKGIAGVHFISKYVGQQYFDNTMNPDRTISQYFVNSLRLDLKPAVRGLKALDLQLFLNNLFNTRFENNAYGGNWYEDGVEKTWAYYFPQAGINFMLKAAITF